MFLLKSKGTGDATIWMRIITPGGEVSYEIPVVKVQDYSLEEIFDKRLLFLLPYYFLRYKLELLENNADARMALRQTYQDIFQRLSFLEQSGEITEFTRQSIKAMIDKVAMFRANRYERVMEEVKEIMGGKILDYEAKDIRNKGIREGKQLGIVEGISIGKEAGRLEGISQNILTMYKKGKTPEEIADLLEKDLEEVKAIIAGKETTIV